MPYLSKLPGSSFLTVFDNHLLKRAMRQARKAYGDVLEKAALDLRIVALRSEFHLHPDRCTRPVVVCRNQYQKS